MPGQETSRCCLKISMAMSKSDESWGCDGAAKSDRDGHGEADRS